MAVKENNWDVIQGDSFSLQITYTDDQTPAQPINLTGFTATLEVRDKPGGKILCATCSLGDGITFTNASQGIIDVLISGSKTRKFVFPRSAYQLKLINGSTETTILNGWFIVDAGVIN